MPLILLVPTLALLGFAAWRDVATRTIPDGISLALAALGLRCGIAEGWHSLAVSLAVPLRSSRRCCSAMPAASSAAVT